jgi:hypothetical protein
VINTSGEVCYSSKHKTAAERTVPLLATPRCNTRYCGHRYDDHDYTLKSCKIDECACCRWDGPEPNIETGRFETSPPVTDIEVTVTDSNGKVFTVKGDDGQTYKFYKFYPSP